MNIYDFLMPKKNKIRENVGVSKKIRITKGMRVKHNFSETSIYNHFGFGEIGSGNRVWKLTPS